MPDPPSAQGPLGCAHLADEIQSSRLFWRPVFAAADAPSGTAATAFSSMGSLPLRIPDTFGPGQHGAGRLSGQNLCRFLGRIGIAVSTPEECCKAHQFAVLGSSAAALVG
jgi:hypothetical protein